MLQDIVVSSVVRFSRTFMFYLNSTTIHGGEELANALKRPKSVPLITVSNHVAAMDDPLVLSAIMPTDRIGAEEVRWTMCASDRCFNKGALLSTFFRAGKVRLHSTIFCKAYHLHTCPYRPSGIIGPQDRAGLRIGPASNVGS
eukprot:scaffold13321_cov39-Prasinocladus_malaysianus.AAC.1